MISNRVARRLYKSVVSLRITQGVSKIRSEFWSILLGIALTAAGVWICIAWATNPIHSFSLIREAEITDGVVLDTYEYWSTDDDGSVDVSHTLLYTFRAPDGTEYKKWSGAMWDTIPQEYKSLPAPTKVEYLPTDPSINRIYGEGAQSMLGWVLKDIFGNLLLIVVVFLPGLLITINAVDNLQRSLRFAKERAKESQSK